LTAHVAGIQLNSPLGETWAVKPVPSGLSAAEGGFEAVMGWYGTKWSIDEDTFNITIETPAGTSGTVTLPGAAALTVDGEETSQLVESPLTLSGGSHTIVRKLKA